MGFIMVKCPSVLASIHNSLSNLYSSNTIAVIITKLSMHDFLVEYMMITYSSIPEEVTLCKYLKSYAPLGF